jgi:hypothetical protein
MKLPKQAKSVMRKGSMAKIEAGIDPSSFGDIGGKNICKSLCGILPEPAKSSCKQAC